jgi:hypothetical protein
VAHYLRLLQATPIKAYKGVTMNNINNTLFDSIISYRNGAKVAGVRVELRNEDIPQAVKNLIKEKSKKSK